MQSPIQVKTQTVHSFYLWKSSQEVKCLHIFQKSHQQNESPFVWKFLFRKSSMVAKGAWEQSWSDGHIRNAGLPASAQASGGIVFP